MILVRVCALILFALIVALEGVEIWRAIARDSAHALITSEHVWMLGFALVCLSVSNRAVADLMLSFLKAVRGARSKTDELPVPKPRRRKSAP